MNDVFNIQPIKSVKEILEEQNGLLDKQVKTSEPKLENLKKKSVSHKGEYGGKRENAGRPKGKKSSKTIEKETAEQEIRRRVFDSLHTLINSQMNVAKGASFLYKIETKRWRTKNGQWKEEKKPPKLVKSQIEIENYLNENYDPKDIYYFITTQRPDNKAIEALFDRVFGKARQAIDLNANLTLEEVLKKHWEARQPKIEKQSDEEFINSRQTNNNAH